MILLLALLAAGETYLTKEEALTLVFPKAAVVQHEFSLSADVHRMIEERCGAVPARQRVFVGTADGRVVGYAMILTEITKTLPATFIVGLDAEGEVTKVAVMSHEEHIGTDCKKERFLRQFEGATAGSNVKVGGGGGMLPVSGATMSCAAVGRAVRKALLVVRHQLIERPGTLQAQAARRKRYLMGSFCEITAEADPAVIEKAFDAIDRVEKAISNWSPTSELARLHRVRTIEAGPHLLAFVRASKRFHEATAGAFDPTVAPLVRLWGFLGGVPAVPADAAVAEALKAVGMDRVRIEGSRVTLPEGVELDSGAIGKGLGCDAAAAVLREAGVTRALVDFGSTAVAIGRWEIALRDPFDAERALGIVVLENESLSSSGSYEKFFKTADGTVYSHVLDPRTGRPARGAAGASVVAPTGAESDAFSTAVFVQAKPPAGRAAVVVRTDRTAEWTDAMKAKLKKADE